MKAVLDTPAKLLVELVARGIELQARGDRLRFRPRAGMTPELAARVSAHKPALLALLAITNTSARGSASGGSGDGDTGDALAAASYTAEEARLLAGAPADIGAAIDQIKRVFPGAELVSIQKADAAPECPDVVAWVPQDSTAGLPRTVAALAQPRDDRTPAAWRDRLLQLAACCENLNPERAFDLRRAAIAMTPALAEAFEERAAIMQYDGRLSRERAEIAAAADTVIRVGNTK